jgi:hypothetical protein
MLMTVTGDLLHGRAAVAHVVAPIHVFIYSTCQPDVTAQETA